MSNAANTLSLSDLRPGMSITVDSRCCVRSAVTVDEIGEDFAVCSRWDESTGDWWELRIISADGVLCWGTAHRPLTELAAA